MKKSVVILILIIYIASIALVSFFGLAHSTWDEAVVSESITITNEDVVTNESGMFVVLTYKEGETAYKINYTLLPEKTTNKAVNFITDDDTIATVSDEGVVTFKKGGVVEVQLIAADGSGASAKLSIYAI